MGLKTSKSPLKRVEQSAAKSTAVKTYVTKNHDSKKVSYWSTSFKEIYWKDEKIRIP